MDKITINDAAHKWVAEMNSYEYSMIDTLMRDHPGDWREITMPCKYNRVYVYNLPEKREDGEPYENTTNYGEIIECLEDSTYRIEMDNGEIIIVERNDFNVKRYSYLPAWGTMWSFDGTADTYWLEELDGIRLMSECGFRIYMHEEWGYFFGIDGGGYSFYDEHWIPLYKARGLKWHNTEED